MFLLSFYDAQKSSTFKDHCELHFYLMVNKPAEMDLIPFSHLAEAKAKKI